jgi:MoxR-like ATPase
MNSWGIFKGDPSRPHDGILNLPAPPGWRTFDGEVLAEPQFEPPDSEFERRLGRDLRGTTYRASPKEVELVNAALFLRRPLLVTGRPGTGKSSLIYAVARELRLGSVLRWPITTRSTLQDGLYRYDAIGRLHAANQRQADPGSRSPLDIGEYIQLGPLGTALLPAPQPRALLIDEIDKSDIDLPNDLLNIFEEGEFAIPELERLPAEQERVEVHTVDSAASVPVIRGRVRCRAFPFVILTSNGERDFPPPFLRRCLRLDIDAPDQERLASIVQAHLGDDVRQRAENLLGEFLTRRETGDLATDQLLNAMYLVAVGIDPLADRELLLDALLRHLSSTEVR